VIQQARFDEGVRILQSQPLPTDPTLLIPAATLEAEAYAEMHNFQESERLLDQAAGFCTTPLAECGYVLKARGVLAAEQGQWKNAERIYRELLAFARSNDDKLLQSHALLNLGNISLVQARYDEAIDLSEKGHRVASAIDARRLELIANANTGWAYYKLGDPEKALRLLSNSEELASRLGDAWTQANQLTNVGYIYMDESKFDVAAQWFQQSLDLARRINAKGFIYNALRVLARLYLQTGDLDKASQYAQQALDIARQDKNHPDELYPMLVEGQIAARRGDSAAAEKIFRSVESDKECPIFLKWEAEHSLARLYEDQTKPDLADHEYRTALATFETARDTVRIDSQLSFLTNASRIYDDYIHFLVSHKKTDGALRWADYSRARTLSEGLGLLPKGAKNGPPPLNAPQIAGQAHGSVFFYWLGENQSYLWAITPQKAKLFPLPPRGQIEGAVGRYRKTLTGPQSGLESPDQSPDHDGLWLYQTLIEPAQEFLEPRLSKQASLKRSSPKNGAPKNDVLNNDAKVFIIPDGALNNLNFETLIVPEPRPHYWIEDASIVNVSSLRVLASSSEHEPNHARKLLLIGDSVSPGPDYPELPRAADQMTAVAGRFSPDQQEIFSRAQATPAAYENSHPEQFSHIHFVAHGTASRLSPLDSAIVLSKDADNPESFKLYARKIKEHPLHADLVTISACYSAGERFYAGEGLVGLAWAFLRAGAHNVIAASWEATDASTQQLMDTLYDDLNRGATPDVALRKAKLSLLHSDGAFRKPFYWAPFQLYAGTLPRSPNRHSPN
jgi:CHAT domain-containing protein/Tfp pilus assembly protein PilF